MKWRRPHPKLKWRTKKRENWVSNRKSNTNKQSLIFLSLSSPETKLKRERKKERKIWSGFDCLCCVYQLSLAGLVISLPFPCWYLANLFAFLFLFSIFLFCFSYLPFYCAAAIAKLVCFFFTPRQCRPLNTNVGERKWKEKVLWGRHRHTRSRVCVNSAGSDWALLLREPHPTSAPFIIKSR